MSFEWDEYKRRNNLRKHRIDFAVVKEIWSRYHIEMPSGRTDIDEERYLAVGTSKGRIVTVVFTWRGENRRLISARKARPYEEENYQNGIGRGS